jgi:hypothetical protein
MDNSEIAKIREAKIILELGINDLIDKFISRFGNCHMEIHSSNTQLYGAGIKQPTIIPRINITLKID